MEMLLGVSILISFIVALIILPGWIKKCKKVKLLWENMNRFGHPRNVASSGGIAVVISFVLGVLFYVAIRTFVLNVNETTIDIFALLSVILILAIVGLTDDLLGWQHGGLSAKFRLLLVFCASIPLVVINAGVHTMSFPFFGVINLGLFYPLVLVPIGVAGATAAYNMLAGFNGLEAGQGIIILSFLSFIAYITGDSWLSLIGLCMVASLLVFYFYNKFPAKVFPGDILTWAIGALIACMAILGNFEKIAVFIFIPYIAEVFLKIRGKLRKQSFGAPQKDGSIKMPYKKVYSLTHLGIFVLSAFKRKVYEKDVVHLILISQAVICLIAFIIFSPGLFGGI